MNKAIAAACCAWCVIGTASAQNYPSKTVRIIVPYPAGGTSDILSRLLSPKLNEAFGQSVIVDNRPGANGNIGADLVAKSGPDGYTLLLADLGALAISPSIYKLPFDPAKDLAPVTMVAYSPHLLAVHPSVPVKTTQELIALARSKPGRMNFAVSSIGGAPHLAGELFKIAADIDMLHIPYKGSGPAVVDVASGRVQVMFDAAPSLLPHIQSGKLRPIAAASAKRNPLAPNVPTFGERGFKGMEILIWYGMLAPAATPPVVLARLNAALRKVLDAPDVQQRFAEQGTLSAGNTPAEFASFMRDDYLRWGTVIKQARVKFD